MAERPKNKMTAHNKRRKKVRHQHSSPCKDCPFARTAVAGWLGAYSPDQYIAFAHSDHNIECHVINGPQCAGAAIYRANTFKRVELPLLTLPRDTETVFATPMEFLAHHRQGPNAEKEGVDVLDIYLSGLAKKIARRP